MQPTSTRRVALVLLFLMPALWTVNNLIARVAPGVIEPHLLALLRWLVAGVLFGVAVRSELWAHRHQILLDWKHYLTLGALGMWICGAWVYIGGRTTSALNIALIYALAPVLIVVLSAWWLRERFAWIQSVGVALALAGVLHVVLKGEWQVLGAVRFVPGDGWILAATLSWTFYSVLLKKWSSPLSATARLAVISMAGVLVLLPFTAWEVLHTTGNPLTLHGLTLALAAAVFPGYGAYLAYSVVQSELGAAQVSTVLYLLPVYAAVLGWLVLGESIHIYHAVGMALVLPGIFLVTRRPRLLAG